MKTLDFARQYIKFDRASLISGPFNDDRYPHIRKPLMANDDIETHTLVVLKAAGCMGTVFLQISIAHHIATSVGDGYFIAQTDEDAKTWSTARGQGFILSIPDVWRLRRASLIERSCFKSDQWSFRHLDFYISGPSKTSRQSKQVRRVWTDESHLTDNYEEGALKEFDDRRQRWGWAGKSVHATTSANAGAEVDRMYYEGAQNEYHWRCPNCDKLIFPLWREVTPTHRHAKEYYGKDIFLWEEMPTEDATLDTIRARCPHCDSIYKDTQQDRTALVGDDYVAMNPNPKRGFDSYRWSVFAIPDLPWRKTLATYREAMAAARLGNLSLMENFCKKQLCGSYTPILPDFGEGKGASDYKLGDAWNCGESEKFMGIDFQAGKTDEGQHFWCLVTQYDRAGNSRRLAYRKVLTFSQLDGIQAEFEVKSENVYIDSGHESRLVFREAGKRHWFTTRGSDESEFIHTKRISKTKTISFSMPFSQGELQSGIIGQKPEKTIRRKGQGVPTGWAWQFVMANPALYSYLSALIGGLSGRYFGIASDFPDEYRKNMPAFVSVIEPDKKTNTVKKVIWKAVRETHPHDCEVMGLLGAIRAGYFPIAKPNEETP